MFAAFLVVFFTPLHLISSLPTWPKFFAPAGWLLIFSTASVTDKISSYFQAVNRDWWKKSSSETVRVSAGAGVEEGGKGKMKILFSEHGNQRMIPMWDEKCWARLGAKPKMKQEGCLCTCSRSWVSQWLTRVRGLGEMQMEKKKREIGPAIITHKAEMRRNLNLQTLFGNFTSPVSWDEDL